MYTAFDLNPLWIIKPFSSWPSCNFGETSLFPHHQKTTEKITRKNRIQFQNCLSVAINLWTIICNILIIQQYNIWHSQEFCPWMLLLSLQWPSCSPTFSSFQMHLKYSHFHEAFFLFSACKLHPMRNWVRVLYDIPVKGRGIWGSRPKKESILHKRFCPKQLTIKARQSNI